MSINPHWLPDGVYIDLREETYFQQGRLGSSDLSKLWKAPADWWWSSQFNPKLKPRKWTFGNDRDYGHGFHYLLLEGEEVYAEKVKISPFDNFQTRDAKQWRDQCHFDHYVILGEEHDEYIRHMVALVQNHPQLAQAMEDGLSEVSVFWTDEQGRRRRARFDKLLPGYILDPKSYGAHNQGRDDHDRALRMVAARSYDVQRFDYDTAREKLVEFVLAGKVFGGSDEDREWLSHFPAWDEERLAERSKLPERHPDHGSAWSWCWLFLQKPSNSAGHAPVVLPLERPRFDLTYRAGKLKVERALQNYDAFKRRFGLGDETNEDGLPSVPWASVHPIWRPDDHDFPPWMDDVSSREHFPTDEEDTTE